MNLRLRIALSFAAVALLTGAAVSIVAPLVIGQGFTRLQADMTGTGGGNGAGQGGPPPGRGPSARAAQIQQDTETTVILVALGAAAVASVAGLAAANRLVRPLRRLEEAAADIASGDLGRRSGLAERDDEVGSLGRSFDRMAAALAASEASRRRLMQDSAHEMRTPLAVIDATASAMLDGVYPAEERHLATIRDQSRVLARMVDDLRTIGLAQDGRLELHREPTPVADLVAEVARSFEARATAAGVTIAPSAPADLLVDVDRDRMRQVLGALVDNALRYSPQAGEVRVAARAAGAVARLEVADDGPGIPEADLPHVFERFYQADESRPRGREGTGLGLAIVRALVEAHGGTVAAMNAAPHGALIRIEIPMAAAAGPMRAATDAEHEAPQRTPE